MELPAIKISIRDVKAEKKKEKIENNEVHKLLFIHFTKDHLNL